MSSRRTRVRLPLGVDQLDGGLGLGGEQAVEDPAVGRWRRCTGRSSPRRSGSGRGCGSSSSSLGCAAIPVRSGPTLPPSPPWRVALGALLLEDELALGGVARRWRTTGRERVDDLLAVGVGQAAAPGEQGLGPRGDRRVGVGGEGLLLVERELVEPDARPSRRRRGSAEVQSARPSRAADGLGADGRGQRRRAPSTSAGPTSGASLRPTASTRPGASAGRGPGRDQRRAAPRPPRRRSGGTRSSCRAASTRAASGFVSSRAVGQEAPRRSRRSAGSSAFEPQRLGQARRAGPGRRAESLGSRRDQGLLGRRRRASPACPWASPRPGRRRRVGDAPGRRPSSAASRTSTESAGAAPGVVLGDPAGDRERPVGGAGLSNLPGGERLEERPRSLAAAAAVAASASQRSPSTSPATRAVGDRRRPPSADGGSSARARKAASRTWGSGSSSEPAARIGRPTARRAGRTCSGVPPDARPTGASGPRRPPRPRRRPRRRARRGRARSRGRGSPPGSGRSRRPTGRSTSATRAGTTSVLPRSTSSRWACSRQNMLSFFRAATQRRPGRSGRASGGVEGLRVRCRRSGRSGRGSCRGAGSRRRPPCRS